MAKHAQKGHFFTKKIFLQQNLCNSDLLHPIPSKARVDSKILQSLRSSGDTHTHTHIQDVYYNLLRTLRLTTYSLAALENLVLNCWFKAVLLKNTSVLFH